MIKVHVMPRGASLVQLTGPVCDPFWIDTETGLDRLRTLILSRYPELLPLDDDLDLHISRTSTGPVPLRDGDRIDMFLKHQTV